MLAWLCTILLKVSVVTETFVPIFQGYRKYLFERTTMIYSSVIQNHQGFNILRASTQPHNYFFWKISCLLNATSFIRISTIDCPHSSLLSIVDGINIERLIIQKENFMVASFRKFVRSQFASCFRLFY